MSGLDAAKVGMIFESWMLFQINRTLMKNAEIGSLPKFFSEPKKGQKVKRSKAARFQKLAAIIYKYMYIIMYIKIYLCIPLYIYINPPEKRPRFDLLTF